MEIFYLPVFHFLCVIKIRQSLSGSEKHCEQDLPPPKLKAPNSSALMPGSSETGPRARGRRAAFPELAPMMSLGLYRLHDSVPLRMLWHRKRKLLSWLQSVPKTEPWKIRRIRRRLGIKVETNGGGMERWGLEPESAQLSKPRSVRAWSTPRGGGGDWTKTLGPNKGPHFAVWNLSPS